MPISDELRAIFIHIPKNAGTSIQKATGITQAGGHYEWWRFQRADPRKWEAYFKFAVVRNPWDRVVSNFLYAQMERSFWHAADGNARFGVHPDWDTLRGATFRQCVEQIATLRHPGWLPQSHWICGPNGESMMDYLCRYEQLELDFAHVCRTLGVKAELPTINVSAGRGADWRHFYDAETEMAVRKHYAADIRLFGYEFAQEAQNPRHPPSVMSSDGRGLGSAGEGPGLP